MKGNKPEKLCLYSDTSCGEGRESDFTTQEKVKGTSWTIYFAGASNSPPMQREGKRMTLEKTPVAKTIKI